ncbi:hypothetical protein [Geminisphaera colitermitum]|uniref:hypothetical protein n=1 Tax=Geminisphaera colitermitum TaxID=1148786 RepID=UPI0001965437|nr:hypothetical protein [Geminisphaera colitermitum]
MITRRDQERAYKKRERYGWETDFDGGRLPDGRKITRGGRMLSAEDAARSEAERARTGYDPGEGRRLYEQLSAQSRGLAVGGGSGLDADMSGRYQTPVRDVNVARARADGQFDSIRSRYNVTNQGRTFMDMDGNIQPAKPVVSATPDAGPGTQAAQKAGDAGGASAEPSWAVGQGSDGKWTGFNKFGERQRFDSQEEAREFSGGFGRHANGTAAEAFANPAKVAPTAAAPAAVSAAPSVPGLPATSSPVPTPRSFDDPGLPGAQKTFAALPELLPGSRPASAAALFDAPREEPDSLMANKPAKSRRPAAGGTRFDPEPIYRAGRAIGKWFSSFGGDTEEMRARQRMAAAGR